MPNLLAMSFEGELTPSFDLRCLHPGRTRPDGWGLGYYPAGEPSASVLKEPARLQQSSRLDLIKGWDQIESSTFLLHIRTATWGAPSDANTQPFSRSFGGREWLFGHSGSLSQRPELSPDGPFEPVGSTDSEVVFCELMNRLAKMRWRSLGDVDPPTLWRWLDGINALGTLNVVFTDGRDLCVYADRGKASGFFAWELRPPYEQVVFADADLEVDLTRRGVKARKGMIIASRALDSTSPTLATWKPIPPGQLWILRQGSVRAVIEPPSDTGQAGMPVSRIRAPRPTIAPPKRLEVIHRTVYRYTNVVEKSSHLLRLVPIHDRLQSLLEHEVRLSVDAEQREYEDVFGNVVRQLAIDTPYEELRIESRSKVELRDIDPLSFRPLHGRTSIPLVWMPWQRHMLAPYLLPPELPESELRELSDYAMSFVERHDYDLLDTLIGMNQALFTEYKYMQGTTTLATTPFQVYTTRQGVCQDFANLFICLARLLGVPARYVCGYLYTGPKHPNQKMSEASHAWVQVYLPEVGWKGFDPTNGVLTQTDHVRVAVGRAWSDATPTSGTIYVGGGAETLEVDVKVTRLDDTSS